MVTGNHVMCDNNNISKGNHVFLADLYIFTQRHLEINNQFYLLLS